MPRADVPVRKVFTGSPEYADRVRARIRAGAIVKRLFDHSVARKGDAGYDQAIMSATQVTAALGLLRKVVPDLLATEVRGEVIHMHVARTNLRELVVNGAEDARGNQAVALLLEGAARGDLGSSG